MGDKDIEIQESLKRIQAASELFTSTMVISMMRVNLLNNLLFSLRAHPYHLGAICQHMTDKGIAYANNTPVCLN